MNDHRPTVPPADLAARLANVDLNLLPLLLALLQERNVTAAAGRIGLSQPAMSHALSRMRSVLDDQLLVRSGQRFVLTPRAAVLLEFVQGILNDVSEGVLNSPAFDPRVHSREFTISMTPSTAFVVSPWLMRAADEAPRVSFQIVQNPEPGVDVFSRPEADLALVADIVSVPYERTLLYRDRWVVVVARENSSVGEEITLDDLSSLDHIAYRTVAIRTQPYIALAAAGVLPRYRLVSSDFLLIPMLVAGTQSVAIVQNRLARSLADRFGLRILEVPVEIPPLHIDVVRNPRLRGDTGVTWLIDALVRHFEFI